MITYYTAGDMLHVLWLWLQHGMQLAFLLSEAI